MFVDVGFFFSYLAKKIKWYFSSVHYVFKASKHKYFKDNFFLSELKVFKLPLYGYLQVMENFFLNVASVPLIMSL